MSLEAAAQNEGPPQENKNDYGQRRAPMIGGKTLLSLL